ETWRDVCMQVMNRNFPGFEPRNDFDIFALGTTQPKDLPAGVELNTWLDEKLARAMQNLGSLEALMENVWTTLDLSSPFQLKPRRMQRDVFVRPIPNSSYSIRLFPGCFLAKEYCLDFVDSKTGVPVNSPFKFELWVVPNPSAPWFTFAPSHRVTSLDSAFGVQQDEILPGHEKFVLRDGQTCLLRRPGCRDVRFTVPIRQQ
ncbi:hypothetical protein C8T65DRAFT_557212, partial [Cerioporus squamosus]